MRSYYLSDLDDTLDFGQTLAQNLKSQSGLFCLEGELGGGKTSFTQGLAQGWGIQERVTSPTFGLVHPYGDPPRVFHFDVYRLSDFDELLELNFEHYLASGWVVIEWANRFQSSLLDYDPLWLIFEHKPPGRLVQIQAPEKILYDTNNLKALERYKIG